jgi:hypothetical protein
MPRGTELPADVTAVALTGGLTLPMYVLWATGRPSPAAEQVIRNMAPD